MTSDSEGEPLPQLIYDWFTRLAAVVPEEREPLLRQAEAAEPGLRAELASLFAHYDLPSQAPGREVRQPLPEVVGPYRRLRLLGRGGSGAVYLAQQLEPVERRVAIKIVPEAAFSPELRQRLAVERQALQRIDHPGIAKILDAGETDAGLPFLVIEYVEGETIVAAADSWQLDLKARIALMAKVADAVQHAHGRGVIHRDLKPGNILVREVDGQATPVVLDFGIAKWVAAPTGLTRGLPLGTPAYMAPEQAGTDDVDVRADVYGLGATLYELVAGRPPIDSNTPVLEALRRIREVEPTPVARLGGAAPRFAAAPASLRSDLDVVLGAALAKEPAQRYATAAEFAADLRRLLANEPIAARPPTWGYRIRCFVRRHHGVAAAAAVALLAVFGGLAALTHGLAEARAERLDQQTINAFLFDDVLAPLSMDRSGARLAGLDMMRQAGDLVASRFEDAPQLARQLHQEFGELFTEMHVFDEAESHLDRAGMLAAVASRSERLRLQVARAELLHAREQNRESWAVVTPLVEQCVATLGDEHIVTRRALQLQVGLMIEFDEYEDAAKTAERVHRLHHRMGDRPIEEVQALGMLAWAEGVVKGADVEIGLLQRALREAHQMPRAPRGTIMELSHNLGVTYLGIGQAAAAEPHLERAFELAQQVLPETHGARLAIADGMAGVLHRRGDYEGAVAIRRDLIAQRTALLGASATPTLRTRLNLGLTLFESRDFAPAAECLEATLSDAKEARAPATLIARTESALAHVLVRMGRRQEALALLDQAVPVLDEELGSANPATQAAVVLRDRVSRRSGR